MAKRTSTAKVSPKPAASSPAPDAERTLHMSLLRSMLLQRRFEERCAEAYAIGRIGGFCHLYLGQEAVSTGTLSLSTVVVPSTAASSMRTLPASATVIDRSLEKKSPAVM